MERDERRGWSLQLLPDNVQNLGRRVPAGQPQSASLPMAGGIGKAMVREHVACGMLVLHHWLAEGKQGLADGTGGGMLRLPAEVARRPVMWGARRTGALLRMDNGPAAPVSAVSVQQQPAAPGAQQKPPSPAGQPQAPQQPLSGLSLSLSNSPSSFRCASGAAGCC